MKIHGSMPQDIRSSGNRMLFYFTGFRFGCVVANAPSSSHKIHR